MSENFRKITEDQEKQISGGITEFVADEEFVDVSIICTRDPYKEPGAVGLAGAGKDYEATCLGCNHKINYHFNGTINPRYHEMLTHCPNCKKQFKEPFYIK